MSLINIMLGNILVIFGGGLVDCATQVVGITAELLANYINPDSIYVGCHSFSCFLNTKDIMHYKEFIEASKNKSGGWVGTTRGINFAENRSLLNIAIENLKALGFTMIVILGGDGSSRQCAEITKIFEENGIHVVFALPMTLDGINGSESIGYNQAVRESLSQTKNFANSVFNTLSVDKYGVACVRFQGRDRDDILAGVLKNIDNTQEIGDFQLKDIKLIAIPTNYTTNYDKLISEVKSTGKPTLILISEGAKITPKQIEDDLDNFRKTRSNDVGHLSQINGRTTDDDYKEYKILLSKIVPIIANNLDSSYDIAVINGEPVKKPYDYFLLLNPRIGCVPKIDPELEKVMLKYVCC